MLKESEYKEVCNICDKILLEKISNYRVANDWLHVIRPHPIYLYRYLPVIRSNNILFFYKILVNGIKYCIHILITLFKSIIKIKHHVPIIDSNIQTIFFSHLLNKNQLNEDLDFYFNKIPKIFDNEKGSLRILLNHTRGNYSKINNIQNTVIIPETLSFIQELTISFKLLKDSLKIISFRNNLKYRLMASVEALSPATHRNIRIGVFTKRLLKSNNIKYLFTTYEGHAWERLVYGLFKQHNKNILNIGYQHAFFFKDQHSISRKLNYEFDPDYILCSGEKAYKKFLNVDFLEKHKLILFGSDKVNHENKVHIKNKNTDTFLILPEGDLIECLPLVDLAISLATNYKKYKFIFRIHPITDKKRLLINRPVLNKPPLNFEFSNMEFDYDLDRSNHAIYRGSTSIISAIQRGLTPIYFHRENQIDINPLHELNEKIFKISCSDDLTRVLLNIKKYDIKTIQNDIYKYFSPIDFFKLNNLTN